MTASATDLSRRWFGTTVERVAEGAPPPFMRGPAAFVFHYVRSLPTYFAGLLGMSIAAAAASVGAQYSMKILVDGMASRQGEAVWAALAGFIALIAFESLMWRLSGWLGCRTTVEIGVRVRLDLFDYLNHQPMQYFARNLAGSLGQRITATAGNFGALTNTLVWRILPPVVDFVGAAIIFAAVDLGMMVALGAYVVVITGGLILFGERGRKHHQTYASLASETAGELVDVITNMWAVKAFSARGLEWRRLSQRFKREAAAQHTSWMYTEKARVIHDVALWIMAGGMLSWAVLLWSSGRITPGAVVVVSALTFRILHGSRDMALSLVEMAQQFGFIEETLRVIAQPQTVCDEPGAPALTRRGADIVFDEVNFSYGDAGDAVHDINLLIPAGQKLGIVGPSGAGKSTLIHLLQRLYDVQHGEIRIGEQAIASVTQDSLRETFAVVPQEITLFHRTVRDNILFGRPGASEAEIIAAARAAACDGFVRNLPQQYDTLVGERGVRLSGGQRQRIGIARAFLKDAPIIVLDEATSSLDTDSELEIQKALVELMRDRTVIAVAHRLSTLAAFDRIVVLVDGRIVEDGPPAALLAEGSTFRRMWSVQARGFALNDDRADAPRPANAGDRSSLRIVAEAHAPRVHHGGANAGQSVLAERGD